MEIHRSGVYYRPKQETQLNMGPMRLIEERNLLHPWLGVPRITTWLQKDKGELHRIYKYLLKHLEIERRDQVWAMDIAHIPVQGGYLYLCAVIDLHGRYPVGWPPSKTMASQWCGWTGGLGQIKPEKLSHPKFGCSNLKVRFLCWV